MALLYLLQKARVPFIAVYIDHGWRKESEEESQKLKKLCEKENIPYESLRVIDFDFTEGNIEDRLREERFKKFQKIAEQYQAQGVILGHHQDDLIETVIKRFFEGSKITRLFGLTQQGDYNGLKLFRPLLGASKKEILAWLEERNIAYFIDSTNEDEQFLRARMRKTMIPLLEKVFGKKFQKNLVEHAKRSKELKSYLDRRIDPIRKQIDLKKNPIVIPIVEEMIEMEHLLSYIGSAIQITLNRQQLKQIVHIAYQGISRKKVVVGAYQFIIQNKKLQIKKSLSRNAKKSEKSSQTKVISAKMNLL